MILRWHLNVHPGPTRTRSFTAVTRAFLGSGPSVLWFEWSNGGLYGMVDYRWANATLSRSVNWMAYVPYLRALQRFIINNWHATMSTCSIFNIHGLWRWYCTDCNRGWRILLWQTGNVRWLCMIFSCIVQLDGRLFNTGAFNMRSSTFWFLFKDHFEKEHVTTVREISMLQ